MSALKDLDRQVKIDDLSEVWKVSKDSNPLEVEGRATVSVGYTGGTDRGINIRVNSPDTVSRRSHLIHARQQ